MALDLLSPLRISLHYYLERLYMAIGARKERLCLSRMDLLTDDSNANGNNLTRSEDRSALTLICGIVKFYN